MTSNRRKNDGQPRVRQLPAIVLAVILTLVALAIIAIGAARSFYGC